MRWRRLCLVAMLASTACGRLNFQLTGDAQGLGDDGAGDGDIAGDASTSVNRAFVTTATFDGNLGGRGAADADCQARADAHGLGGTWIALLANGTERANARLVLSRGWVDLSGLPIADLYTDWLDGHLQHPLRRDESNALVGYELTWLGSGPVGDCAGWTTNTTGNGGTVSTTQLYSEVYGQSCAQTANVVCVEIGKNVPVQTAAVAGRLAFVSQGVWMPGNGMGDADLLCATEATAASRPGSYLAALATSTNSSPFARFTLAGPTWTRVDGIPLMPTGAALGNSLNMYFDTFASLAADGTPMLNAYMWSGDPFDNCTNWGSAMAGKMAWTGEASDVARVHFQKLVDVPCNMQRKLLCMQE